MSEQQVSVREKYRRKWWAIVLRQVTWADIKVGLEKDEQRASFGRVVRSIP